MDNVALHPSCTAEIQLVFILFSTTKFSYSRILVPIDSKISELNWQKSYQKYEAFIRVIASDIREHWSFACICGRAMKKS